MKIGLLFIGIGLFIIGGGMILKGMANYNQWVIDQAYNKGRAMEKVCAKSVIDSVVMNCTHHYQNTGHTLNPSIKD